MRLAQPDRRSCGAAALVMARRAMDAPYAARVADEEAFASEVTAMHRRVTSLVDSSGGLQVPWLRMIGTPPWATARELSLLTGVDYGVHAARRGGQVWEHVREATQQRPVAGYVGDRWTPRHVVLALGRTGDSTLTYEPSAG